MSSSEKHPWEFGSEFHWPSFEDAPATRILSETARLFASGRDAIRALIADGMSRRGWRRWFVPAYLCQEVVEAIAGTGIEIVFYEDSPLFAAPPPLPQSLRQGDALFLVNYFGLRGAGACKSIELGPADLVEDHTHDPWSDWARESGAAYCIASLRKTVPIPAGGAVWSPSDLPLPNTSPATPDREAAILMKWGAMLLKRLYLTGHPVAKESFRSLQLRGEEGIAAGDVSGIDCMSERMLACLPWNSWREKRRQNHALLSKSFEGVPGIEVLQPTGGADSCPFAVIVLLPSWQVREAVRSALIASAIYPAILWPIASERHAELLQAERLSGRVLAFACDFRYGAEDLLRVAERLQTAVVHYDTRTIQSIRLYYGFP